MAGMPTFALLDANPAAIIASGYLTRCEGCGELGTFELKTDVEETGDVALAGLASFDFDPSTAAKLACPACSAALAVVLACAVYWPDEPDIPALAFRYS